MQSLSFSSPKWNTKTVVFLGMFVAMSVVLQQFSFGPSFVRISPAFFATILMGYYFGPWTAAIGAAIADQMHVMLFMPGQNFLGFTVSAAVGAMIYGMLFHEKKVTAWRVLLGVALVIFIVNIGLNTMWLNMMGTPWRGIIWPRTVKNAVMLPIQTFLAYATLKAVERIHPRLS